MRFIVTRTTAFRDRGPWGESVDVVADEVRSVQRRGNYLPKAVGAFVNRWSQFQFGLRLLWTSRRYDAMAVGDNAIWFPVLYRLLGGRKRIVLTGVDWPGHGSGLLNRWAASGCSAVCCNTRAEIERYSRHFKIPQEKFRLVLMAFQRSDIERWTPSDEGYIFAGGNTDRDWETLLRAVESLPYAVRIYTSTVGLP